MDRGRRADARRSSRSRNNVYAVVRTGSADGAIWKNSGGTWSQLPGAGQYISSLPDSSLYVVNSLGWIFNLPSGSSTYAQCVGTASRIVPAAGGAGYFSIGFYG